MTRAIVLVLDSFGIGSTDDAETFGDDGANTLGSIARVRARSAAGPLKLPNLARLGLFEAARDSAGDYPEGTGSVGEVTGTYGYADLIEKAELPGVLGNCHSSGTTIIAELGDEHVRTGKPIVYTSADSVFQIACHEESFGLERLYSLCEIARELVDEYNIGRVIARPFIGTGPDNYTRTGNRRDLTTPPPAKTVLDKLAEAGGEVISIGKIADIYAHQGITKKVKATGNAALFDATLTELQDAPDRSIVFTNFVDFDMLYGHRDVEGYAAALEYFDRRLPELLDAMQDEDLLIITADHGCDPTWAGSDHTREHIPVVCFGAHLKPGSIGKRDTFADIGQTLASYFELAPMDYGRSFLHRDN